MKLSEIELSDEHLSGLVRLLGKVNASAATSRDSSDITRRTFGYEIKAGSVDEKARSLRVVASTDAIDSYDEIVKQDWDLRRYLANPVVLYAHNSAGLCGPADETLPIGYASDIAVVNGQLEATLHFVTKEATELAEKVWQGVKQGSLRAVSVGFRPHKVVKEYREDDGREIDVLSENELFEISVVPIPANPEAVARSAARNKAQAKRLAANVDRSLASVEQRMNPAAAGSEQEDENPMKDELEKAQAALEAKTAELDKVKAELDAANALIKEHGEAIDTTAKALAEQRKRADDAEAKVAELEVDALVGKKITPAEKAAFLKLRTSDKALFDEMVAQKADISSLTQDVTGDDKSPRNKAADAGGASGRLAKKALKAARS